MIPGTPCLSSALPGSPAQPLDLGFGPRGRRAAGAEVQHGGSDRVGRVVVEKSVADKHGLGALSCPRAADRLGSPSLLHGAIGPRRAIWLVATLDFRAAAG